MSLCLEESPLSDNKMDISDTTPSLDSAVVSPVAEEECESKIQLSSQYNHNDHTPLKKRETQNEGAKIRKPSQHLDNRIVRSEVFPLESSLSQRQNVLRTLAKSHPLMSPTGTDSDSEHSHVQMQQIQTIDLNCHNFPDVVPRSERLQSPPLSNANAVSVFNTLNSYRGKINTSKTPAHNKLTLLRAHSPDLLSSESEADVSQYHAAVEANFQSVALISNVPITNCPNNKGANHLKSSMNGTAAGGDDISSLDSISNHSFDDDEDLEHNLASLSPSSSLIDGLDDDDDDDDDCEGPELIPDTDDNDFPEIKTPTPNSRPLPTVDVLPQYSAAEERRDSRNWQKITLPDGRTREIDMRVIEPYKRVLSHGGYLKAGGHNAIVIFCACHLPDRSRADYNYVMDNLFLYVVKTLEQLVTEDYVLIYLHGGSNRRNVPPFPWLKRCYQLLDRRLRKSLKNMYLVHPTFWIKSIVWMARPFVSTKFWRKLIYVKSLAELNSHVSVEKAAIPEKVKQYDAKHN